MGCSVHYSHSLGVLTVTRSVLCRSTPGTSVQTSALCSTKLASSYNTQQKIWRMPWQRVMQQTHGSTFVEWRVCWLSFPVAFRFCRHFLTLRSLLPRRYQASQQTHHAEFPVLGVSSWILHAANDAAHSTHPFNDHSWLPSFCSRGPANLGSHDAC